VMMANVIWKYIALTLSEVPEALESPQKTP
jgi:hypothetical protein